jgi:hypothetical protein
LLQKFFHLFFKYCQSNFCRVAECFERKLVEASWASYALEEFLAMKGRHTPSGLDMDVDPHFDGPIPPPCPSMKASDWKAVRNSFLFMRESKINRSVSSGQQLTSGSSILLIMVVDFCLEKTEKQFLIVITSCLILDVQINLSERGSDAHKCILATHNKADITVKAHGINLDSAQLLETVQLKSSTSSNFF